MRESQSWSGHGEEEKKPGPCLESNPGFSALGFLVYKVQ
jgi:hypothetical protein